MEKIRKFRGPQAVKGEATSIQFETYTSYSGIDDEERVLGGFNGSFLRNLVGRGQSLFNFFKIGLLKKSFRNPGIEFVKNKMSSLKLESIFTLFNIFKAT